MTKRDLVMRISDETGLIQEDVKAVIQKSLDYIVESLERMNLLSLENLVFLKYVKGNNELVVIQISLIQK